MLRVTVDDIDDATFFEVEGSLTQPSAEELKKCWEGVAASASRLQRLVVNLTAMTNIDSAGKKILQEMHKSGVRLIGSGVMTRALIEEIMGGDR
ncbi:MAG: STAS domain-containing protein [Acidobacteriota bacterium]